MLSVIILYWAFVFSFWSLISYRTRRFSFYFAQVRPDHLGVTLFSIAIRFIFRRFWQPLEIAEILGRLLRIGLPPRPPYPLRVTLYCPGDDPAAPADIYHEYWLRSYGKVLAFFFFSFFLKHFLIFFVRFRNERSRVILRDYTHFPPCRVAVTILCFGAVLFVLRARARVPVILRKLMYRKLY